MDYIIKKCQHKYKHSPKETDITQLLEKLVIQETKTLTIMRQSPSFTNCILRLTTIDHHATANRNGERVMIIPSWQNLRA